MHSRTGKASFGLHQPSREARASGCRSCDTALAERRASVLQRSAPRCWRVRQGLPMAFPVRCCALVGRFADSRIAESVSALLPHLASRGVQVLVAEGATLAAGTAGVTRVAER